MIPAKHIVLDLFGCPTDLLNDLEKIESILAKAAELAGATILKSAFHKFNPQGVTGIIIVAESHLAIHTWPEKNYAAVDIFTCGRTNPKAACELIIKKFSPKDYQITELRRGA